MPTDPSMHRNLPLLLLHAREAALAHFRPILKRFRLTEQQWRILRVLACAPAQGMEAGQIADACKILSPSLTGILSRLEQMRLIRREWSEKDQRRQIIGLSQSGTELVARVLPQVDAQYRRIEEALGKQTLEEIYAAIDRIALLLGRPLPDGQSYEGSPRGLITATANRPRTAQTVRPRRVQTHQADVSALRKAAARS